MSLDIEDPFVQEQLNRVADSMLLKDDEVSLIPVAMEGDEREYLLSVAMKDKYNRTPRKQIEKGLEFIQFSWVGKVHGTRGGVVFLCYLENLKWWTLDAYKDDDALNGLKGDFSHRAGRLVIDWFFEQGIAEELHTIHRTENRAATLACKRLGFIEKSTNPQFICLNLRRSSYGAG